jgi:hypothetical protein
VGYLDALVAKVRGHTVRNKATHIISAYRAALQLDPAATERVFFHRTLDQLTRP